MHNPVASNPGTTSNVLELEGVSKFFPGVIANDKIDFTLQQGEIHTVLGEHGAGKSTLMNIIAGLYPPDEGILRVHGPGCTSAIPPRRSKRGSAWCTSTSC